MRNPPIAVALLAVAIAAGAPAAADDGHGPRVGFDRMAYADLDGDGRVSRDEFWRLAPGFSGAVFVYADLDNDGWLNRRELDRAERRMRRNESRGRKRLKR